MLIAFPFVALPPAMPMCIFSRITYCGLDSLITSLLFGLLTGSARVGSFWPGSPPIQTGAVAVPFNPVARTNSRYTKGVETGEGSRITIRVPVVHPEAVPQEVL